MDTNLLTAYADVESLHRGQVIRFVRESSLRLRLAPKSIYEFWSVATRPRNVNGLAMSPEEAGQSVDGFRRAFVVHPAPSGLLEEWLNLCRAHGVSGKNAHDARLAAYARLNGMGTLVTLNARDFARYGLNVVVP